MTEEVESMLNIRKKMADEIGVSIFFLLLYIARVQSVRISKMLCEKMQRVKKFNE